MIGNLRNFGEDVLGYFMEKRPELTPEEIDRSRLVQGASDELFADRDAIIGTGADAEAFEASVLPLYPPATEVTVELGRSSIASVEAAPKVEAPSPTSPANVTYIGAGAINGGADGETINPTTQPAQQPIATVTELRPKTQPEPTVAPIVNQRLGEAA